MQWRWSFALALGLHGAVALFIAGLRGSEPAAPRATPASLTVRWQPAAPPPEPAVDRAPSRPPAPPHSGPELAPAPLPVRPSRAPPRPTPTPEPPPPRASDSAPAGMDVVLRAPKSRDGPAVDLELRAVPGAAARGRSRPLDLDLDLDLDASETPKRSDPSLEMKGYGFTATVDAEGRPHFEDDNFLPKVVRPSLGGLADDPSLGIWLPPPALFGIEIDLPLTEWLLILLGDDLGHPGKMAYLEATKDERVRRRAEAHRDRLEQAIVQIDADLRALWAQPAPAEAKRRALLALWADARTDGPDDVVVAGLIVRARIARFVRTELPKDHPAAFRPAELVAFNESREVNDRFEPYAPGDP